MILSQIEQLIERVVAPESGCHEHTNVPVVHPFPPGIGARGRVDVVANQLQDVVGQFSLAIHMLQRSENRNDAVAAVDIQLHFFEGQTVEPQLF